MHYFTTDLDIPIIMTKRQKVNSVIAAEIDFLSNRLCCVCGAKGEHIHHISKTPSDSSFHNLALLCFKCHNEASIKGNIARKLSPETIIRFREDHYKKIDVLRKQELKVFDSPIDVSTSEDVLNITKTAIIILELDKIRHEYYNAKWSKRDDVLNKIYLYSKHSNFRIAHDVFTFLHEVAGQTRGGMTKEVALTVFYIVTDFFPYSEEDDNKKVIQLSQECVFIASNIIYDSVVYLKNYGVYMYSLLILKFVYQKGKSLNLPALIDIVNNEFKEIESLLKGNSKNFEHGIELLKIYKKDIVKGSLTTPPLPAHILKDIKL